MNRLFHLPTRWLSGSTQWILFLCSIFLTFTSLLASCSDDDSFTASPTATLTFSADSVIMDTVFATVPSRTYDFWVYNHSRASVRLKSVRLKNGNQTGFRVNVDGSYLDNSTGSIVNDLEVRKGDSIRVFVELTAPGTLNSASTTQYDDDLLFLLESGVEQRVCLRGYSVDALQWRDAVISSDSIIESSIPIIIYGGMRVDSGAVLTVRNTTLYFHDKAGIDVFGTLKTENALMRGDRLDRMFDYLPYDRVSGQWHGIDIHESSYNNELTDTEIRSAEQGIVCTGDSLQTDTIAKLTMLRSVIHNCKGPGLFVTDSNVKLSYCQFTNTLGDCVAVYGGTAIIEQCTLAQFYPFSADRGAALRFAPSQLMVKGSIITGYDADVIMGENLNTQQASAEGQQEADGQQPKAFFYKFENSLLRTPVVEDSISFVNVRWETPEDSVQGKQHFRLIDEENLKYDFHLDSLSTAHGLGCYVDIEE